MFNYHNERIDSLYAQQVRAHGNGRERELMLQVNRVFCVARVAQVVSALVS